MVIYAGHSIAMKGWTKESRHVTSVSILFNFENPVSKDGIRNVSGEP